MAWRCGTATAVVAFLLGFAALQIKGLRGYVAVAGFSPLEYAYERLSPDQFERDWPNALELGDASLVLQAYYVALRLFGLAPERLLPAFIAGGVVAVAAGSWFLCRALRLHEIVGDRGALLLAAIPLVVASSARSVDLGQFGNPIYLGQYYAFEDAIRLLALGLVVQRRWKLAGAALALAFAVHPGMGALTILVVTVGMGAAERCAALRRTAPILGAVGVLALGWAAWNVPAGGHGLAGIPHDEWLHYNAILNVHWLPLANGTFTFRNSNLVGFLTLAALYTWACRRVPVPRSYQAMVVASLVLTALGVVFATVVLHPTLLRLCLLRASTLFALLALPVVIAQLLRVWTGAMERPDADGAEHAGHSAGSRHRARSSLAAAAAGLVLLSPFFADSFAPFASGLLILVAEVSERRPGWPLITGLAVALLLVVGGYALSPYGSPGIARALTGGRWVDHALMALCLGGVILTVAGRSGLTVRLALAGPLLVGASSWAWDHRLERKLVPWHDEYYAVQIWAREETPPRALFMTDPSICYGWRDFSRRSSFGNYREWLNKAWVYSSDRRLFEEGKARAAALGVDPQDYPATLRSGQRLRADVRRGYYTRDDAWRRAMAARYGIDYFVYVRAFLADMSSLPVVYENRAFVVLAARDPGTSEEE